MANQDKLAAAADFLVSAHAGRQDYANLPPHLAPATVTEAYDVQAAFNARMSERFGPVAGMKIATTTRVMQQLMGIDHPCGGEIFAGRVHASPGRIRLADYVNLRLECEIAVRLGSAIVSDGPIDAGRAMNAVAEIAPAFELIEDRNAVYRQTNALSLIADNAWNGGIVHGPWQRFDASVGLAMLEGLLTIDGREVARGRPDGPFEALAWVAELARQRGRPLKPGMVVITGSIIATFDPPPGADIAFALGPLGEVRLQAS
jgi:2-keto-4-pentenoate hydratase